MATAGTPGLILEKKGLQKGKRKKSAEAEQKNIYSPNEETLERLILFYHGGKVSMVNTMEI